jgi:aspartate/tyrosine/aromatic aminotransferase
MFERIQMAAPDPILGLTEAYNQDANPHKINLGVGVYKDADGNTPVLASVKRAEARVLEQETTKNYKPIPGDPAYGTLVRELLFGSDHAIIKGQRAAILHTPGGTGALRIAGDYLKTMHDGASLWLSDPTWANHPAVFQAAGLPIKTYPYLDTASNTVAFESMTAALQEVPAGDVVLLHGGCHNPTGVDLTPEQFTAVGRLLTDRKALPLIDFAYQGLAVGLEEDAAGLRALSQVVDEFLVCSSFSKNFGLYNERVGALTIVAASEAAAQAVLSQIKLNVRRCYSNPPAHGAAIVTTILNDSGLRAEWEVELKQMRDRINGMRHFFATTLDEKGVSLSPGGNGFITAQRGMFSMSGLNREQVGRLRDEFSIYVVGSGRINVAGMTERNMPYLCDAIAKVCG